MTHPKAEEVRSVAPYREFVLRAFASPTPGAEVIPLLAQVMDAYRDLRPTERAAVAAWFSGTYGVGEVPHG